MDMKKVFRFLPLAAMVTLPVSGVLSAVAQAGPYSVIDKWVIGGEGGWDYLAVDAVMHKLYLTHGTRVEVVDTESGKSVGAITDLKGVHGVAVDDAGKYGYISDGRANEVVVFDRKTYAKVKSIAVGTNPDGIWFEPVTKTVWAFNGKTNDASVIDTEKMEMAGTVKLPGRPEFPASDGKGNMFVNIEDKNSITKIDAKGMKVVSDWKLAGCESPSGLAMDTARGHLFSVCDGKKMAVTDAATGKQLAAPTIGDGPDAAGFDAKNGVVFSSNGDGTLTVVDAKTYKVLQTVTTQKGARTMAFDPNNGKVYLLAAKYGATPAATAAMPHPRPAVEKGTFTVLVVGRK